MMMKKSVAAAMCAAAVITATLPAAGAVDTVPAVPTRNNQTVYVDSIRVYPTGYNIGGSNYFRLRDIAKLAGFGVTYDAVNNVVEITTDRVTPQTSGIKDNAVAGATAQRSNQRIAVDGIYARIGAYNIGGSNYVKLRDIALNVDFAVDYDNATQQVTIRPNSFYGSEPDAGNSSSSATTVTDAMLRQWEQEMIVRINEEREKVGAAPLVQDEMCMEFARFWAQHLATVKFEHSSISDMYAWAIGADVEDVLEPDGSFFMTEEMGKAIERIGGLENITGAGRLTGIGYDPMTLAMNSFMNSEGHRNSLLSTDMERVGVGFAVGTDGQIWCCQTFGG